MTASGRRTYAEGVLSGLKDFQRRTAEYAFRRLYGSEDTAPGVS